MIRGLIAFLLELSLSVLGNLALSRALGDFVFKRNDRLSAEEQIVTGKKALSKSFS